MSKAGLPRRPLALAAAGLIVAVGTGIAHSQDGPSDVGQGFALQRDGRGAGLRPYAEPGEIVATELAFARLAKDKGQWTAFAKYAAKDAVMFVPEAIRAQQWLKGRKNPAATVEWEPYQVWLSCDGSVAVTKGPWSQPGGSIGYFTTIWQRQQDATYKWVLDQGDALAKALDPPDFVKATIADCPPRRMGAFGGPPSAGKPGKRGKIVPAPVAADGLSGSSNDGSLSWQAAVGADKSRELHVSLKQGDAMAELLTSRVAAPAE